MPLLPQGDPDRVQAQVAAKLQALHSVHGNWPAALHAYTNQPPDLTPPDTSPPVGTSIADVLQKAATSGASVGVLKRPDTARSTVVTRDQLPALIKGPVARTIHQLQTGSTKQPTVDVALDHNEPLAPLAGTAINVAEQYLKTPYLMGGADPRKGLDGPGFLRSWFRQQGTNLSNSTAAQMRSGDKVDSPSDLAPGDLVFITPDSKGPPEGGLYLGQGQFIRSCYGGKAAKISSLNDPHYADRFLQGRHIPTQGGSNVSGS